MNTASMAASLAAAKHSWSDQYAAVALSEYERFCSLAVRFPSSSLVPSIDVDMIWHEHVDIAQDDESVPQHTVHTTDDMVARYCSTLVLYESEFGTPNQVWVTDDELATAAWRAPATGRGRFWRMAECRFQEAPRPDPEPEPEDYRPTLDATF